MGQKTVRLHITIPQELDDAIKEASRRLATSKNRLCREILRQGIAQVGGGISLRIEPNFGSGIADDDGDR